MRATLVLAALVLAGGVAAAPRPSSPMPRDAQQRAKLRADSRLFAQQLLRVTDQVVDNYVRPVSRAELLHAGLTALYQAAHRPVPRDLPTRVKRACTWHERGLAVIPVLPPGPPGGLIPVAAAVGSPDPSMEDFLRGVYEETVPAADLGRRDPATQAVLLCCYAMVRILDRHSGVITASETQNTIGLDPEIDGVGLELSELAGLGTVRVLTVQFGGPAQRAGLRPGDVITHLGGKPVGSAPPPGLLALTNRRVSVTLPDVVAGPARPAPEKDEGPIRVTFRRPGEGRARTVELRRERFRPETVLGVARREDNGWEYFADRKRRVAHLRLAALGRGTADELRGVLAGLAEGGMLGGLLLDLRWCPGGYLNEAVEVAELFLGNGVVATVHSRGRPETVYRSTAAGNKLTGFPVVVLVNGDTMGGAELIAAALQDHKRAAVAGQRSQGKASVQTPLAIEKDVALKLTSGTFARPSGKNLHRFADSKPGDDWGVRPEPEADCRLSPELGRRLRDWWQLQSLRPGPSMERLPLDDPAADPQRQAALALLRGKAD
jgi:carboxyl-terminal processing protease